MNNDYYSQLPNEDILRNELNNLFKDFGMELKGNIGEIMYAKRCFVRNGPGMHLVLSGTKGSVTVLIINGEYVHNRMMIRGTCMDWILTPCSIGSLAIIGNKDEPLDAVENAISANIRWTYLH